MVQYSGFRIKIVYDLDFNVVCGKLEVIDDKENFWNEEYIEGKTLDEFISNFKTLCDRIDGL